MKAKLERLLHHLCTETQKQTGKDRAWLLALLAQVKGIQDKLEGRAGA